jgi:hypothetical protein
MCRICDLSLCIFSVDVKIIRQQGSYLPQQGRRGRAPAEPYDLLFNGEKLRPLQPDERGTRRA